MKLARNVPARIGTGACIWTSSGGWDTAIFIRPGTPPGR
jgi:hypothetical protein